MSSFGAIRLSTLAERMGQEKVGGCHPEGTWQHIVAVAARAVEKPWSALGGSFPAQTGIENTPYML